ncbi:major facilitator superfamily domain-containing protein [Tricladium varicosporioides]|nr:major facilitator superfamily domain-containing protein [Hymenoscyphus varicosporioides]
MTVVNINDLEADVVPGTELLLSKAGSQNGDADQILLIPEPSDEPDDPLNWSPTWKAIVVINQAIFVFISILTPLAIAPLTPIFIHEFQKTLPQVNMLFGAAAMALGYANFIIVPFSNIFGRRPTIIICGLICVLANIWQALVTSYPSFLGARVISGLGAAANESIMPMVVADVMFLHQRGLWMGLYFWSYFIGVFFGPIISGNIAAHVSWRWFFWVCTILQGFSLIVMILLFPETRYSRSPSPPLSSTASSNSSTIGRATTTSEPKVEPVITAQTTNPPQVTSPTSDLESGIVRASRHTTHIIGRPSRAQFSLIPRRIPNNALKHTIIRDVFAPIQIFTYPIVLWVVLAFGMSTNCLLALNLTQSQVFAAPPYLFTPAQVGFVNFAFVVGGIIGLCTAGPISDAVSIYLARRNGGVREAEMRLWTMIPYIAICLIGMVITGVGYQEHYNWPVIVVVGYGFVGIECVSIPTILISYAVDCYKHIPGQIMVSATIVKNTFGFGMIFYFNDWAIRSGFIPPVMTLMALAVGICTIGTAVFLIWGKQFRRTTQGSKLHLL